MVCCAHPNPAPCPFRLRRRPAGRIRIKMRVWEHFNRYVAHDYTAADAREADRELAFVHYSPYLQDPRFVFDKLIRVLRTESADMDRAGRNDEARELQALKDKLEELTHVRDLLGHQVQLSHAKELTVSDRSKPSRSWGPKSALVRVCTASPPSPFLPGASVQRLHVSATMANVRGLVHGVFKLAGVKETAGEPFVRTPPVV